MLQLINRHPKIARIITAGSAIGSAVLGTPQVIFAQEELTILPPTNLLPRVGPGPLLQGIIRMVLIAAFVVAFLILLVGGVRWIIAGGEKSAVESARNMVTGALIGLVVVLSAFAIIRLVEIFFNVNVITGPTLQIPSLPNL